MQKNSSILLNAGFVVTLQEQFKMYVLTWNDIFEYFVIKVK